MGITTLREHSIIYNEASSCGNKGHNRQHSTSKDVATGHIYNLWPFTNITAHIVALNDKYEGQPSLAVRFATKEGGEYHFSAVFSCSEKLPLSVASNLKSGAGADPGFLGGVRLVDGGTHSQCG